MFNFRRLAKDQASLRQSLPPNYLWPTSSSEATPDDLTQLIVQLTGAEGTPYSQGLWTLQLRIPNEYPKLPPKATFRTRIFHPNVDESTGTVCLETLKRDWDPRLTLRDILVTISCLLIHPNPDSALNEKAGVLVREDYDGFSRQAKLMTKVHAPIPEKLVGMIDEARRRGEDEGAQRRLSQSVNAASAITLSPKLCQPRRMDSEDSLKENDPSRALCPAQPLSVSGAKRPLVDDDSCAAVTEPLRKSPKYTHNPQRSSGADLSDLPSAVSTRSESYSSSALSIGASSTLRGPPSRVVVKLRSHARTGIRRL